MTPIEKALLNKELAKVQASLQRAGSIAANAKEHELAIRLAKRQRAIGDEITRINGGPLKLTGADLLNS